MITKNIWIFSHDSQQPPYNTMLRYHNWGKQLSKRGYKVSIIGASTVHNTDIDVVDEIGKNTSIVDGVRYIYLKCIKYNGNIKRAINNLMYIFKIYTLKREGTPDIIITSGPFYNRMIKLVYKDVPLITDIADLWPKSIVCYTNATDDNPIIKMMYKEEEHSYLSSDALIFSMEGGKQYLKERAYHDKIDFGRVYHINMGCDLEEFDRNALLYKDEIIKDPNHFVITYSGSMRQANHIIQICEAAKILQKKGSNILIHMYGNGPEEEQAKKYCYDNHLENILFFGRFEKAKLPVILGSSDANIMTYLQTDIMKYGGSQSKLFDYLASGKPVINCGTWGYNLISRYNCGIVDEKQTSISIADAMQRMSQLPKDELEEMGKRARQVAEMYDQPKLADQLEIIIREVSK